MLEVEMVKDIETLGHAPNNRKIRNTKEGFEMHHKFLNKFECR